MRKYSVTDYFMVIIAMWWLFSVLATEFGIGFDDTDDYINKERSGVTVLTDHKSGCQYLSRAFFSLTPRLDANGNPVCRNSK